MLVTFWMGAACVGEAASSSGAAGDVREDTWPAGDAALADLVGARDARTAGTDAGAAGAVRPEIPEFGRCGRLFLQTSTSYGAGTLLETVGLSNLDWLTGESADGYGAICQHLPGGHHAHDDLTRTVHTWSLSEGAGDAFWEAVAAVDWETLVFEDHRTFVVPHATEETISIVCDETELIIRQRPDYLEDGSPNEALHRLIWETLWPRDCDPWPLDVFQDAEVTAGWERTLLPGVPATSVLGCAGGLAFFNDREIWLSDADAQHYTLLPSVTAGIADDGDDASHNRVVSLGCAGPEVYVMVMNRYRAWADRWRRIAVLDTTDPAPQWAEVTDTFGPGRVYAVAGSADLAVIFGEHGAVARDGTGDRTAYTLAPVLAAAVTRRPGLDTFWALRDGPETAFYAYDNGTGWRTAEGALPPDAVAGELQFVSLGSTSLLLDVLGALCRPNLGVGGCDIVGGPQDEHGWVRLSSSDAPFVIVGDWRVPNYQRRTREHVVQLSRVYPDPNRPPEPVLTSDRMTRPPGMYVNDAGKVFVPAGEKLVVLEETAPAAQ